MSISPIQIRFAQSLSSLRATEGVQRTVETDQAMSTWMPAPNTTGDVLAYNLMACHATGSGNTANLDGGQLVTRLSGVAFNHRRGAIFTHSNDAGDTIAAHFMRLGALETDPFSRDVRLVIRHDDGKSTLHTLSNALTEDEAASMMGVQRVNLVDAENTVYALTRDGNLSSHFCEPADPTQDTDGISALHFPAENAAPDVIGTPALTMVNGRLRWFDAKDPPREAMPPELSPDTEFSEDDDLASRPFVEDNPFVYSHHGE